MENIETVVSDVNNTAPETSAAETTETQEVENLASETEQTNEPKNETTETQEKPYTLKVNGQEVKATLEEMQKWAQLGMGSDVKFKEAAKARKEAERVRSEAEQFVKVLRENPRKILEDKRLGIDLKQLAQQILWEEIQAEQMSPEQRELLEAKRKIEEYENQQKQFKEQEQQRILEANVKHWQGQYEKEIIEGLQTVNLPKSTETVRRMAYYMQLGLKQGVQLKAADVAPFVKKDYDNMLKELFGSTDGDTLTSLLGDNLKKIREAEVKRLQGQQNKKEAVINQEPVVNDNAPKKFLSKEEWIEELDRRTGKIR